MGRAVGRRWLAVLAALPVMVCESPWERASERRRLEGRNGTAGGAHPAANAMRGFRTRDMQELNINPGDRPASGARAACAGAVGQHAHAAASAAADRPRFR